MNKNIKKYQTRTYAFGSGAEPKQGEPFFVQEQKLKKRPTRSSASHPFYTGEEKIIDTEGRVDRFKSRAKKAEALRASLGNKVKKAEKEAAKKAEKAEK